MLCIHFRPRQPGSLDRRIPYTWSMAYRSDEQALRLRREQLQRELTELEREEAELRARLDHEQRLTRRAEQRLREAGPGAGLRRSGRRDRVDLAVAVLVLVALPLALLHIPWHRYIHRDPTVIPAILWLGTPGLVGAILAWPYRRRGRRFRLLLTLALGVALLPLLNLVLG